MTRSSVGRIVRPLLLLAAAVAMTVVLVAVGRRSSSAVQWGDLSGWLEATDPLDVVVEAVRVGGIVLAGYLGVVATLVLMAELLVACRLVRSAGLVRRLAESVAVGAVRRRVVQAAAVSSVAVTLGSGPAAFAASGPVVSPGVELSPEAPAPSSVPVDAAAAVLPPVQGEYSGFGVNWQARYVTVVRGDTLRKIAIAEFGDENRWHDIFDLNVGVPQASGGMLRHGDVIEPGWQLLMPVLATAPLEVPPAMEELAPLTPVHVVERGQSLWRIIPLAYRVEASPERVQAVFDANRDQLIDPDRLEIGQVLAMPVLAGAAGAAPEDILVVPAPEMVAPAVEAPPPELAPVPLPEPVVEVTVSDPVPALEQAPAPEPTAAQVAAPEPPAEAPTSSVPETPTMTAGGDAIEENRPGVPWVAGLSGATVLATGLAGMLAFRRRQRMVRRIPGTPLPPVSARSDQIEAVVRQSAAGGVGGHPGGRVVDAGGTA